MGKLLQMPLLFGDEEPAIPDDDTPLTARAPVSPPPPATPAATPATTPSAATEAPDAAQRREALDIQRSWIVEAPAGSGKTGLLIQRYLKLLAYGGVEAPHQVLALTFTRKADAEMRHRVLEQLKAAAAGTPLPAETAPFELTSRQLALAVLERDRALGWAVLEDPRQLNIRTLDSLCAELAGSVPLLAGAGGRYSPTDDPQPLYDLAAERTLLAMGGHDPGLTRDLRSLLLLRDARPAEFVSLLADMLRQRDQWGELVPLEASRLSDEALETEIRPRLTRTLERLITRELRAAADLLGPGLLQAMAHLAHEFSACAGYKDGPNPFAACAELSEAPGTGATDLPHWLCLLDLLLTKAEKPKWRTRFNRNDLGVDFSIGQQQGIQYLTADAEHRTERFPKLPGVLGRLRLLPSIPYPEEQWHYVKALCRVLRQALLELQIVFAERRQCDFTEVALTARQLLRSEGAGPDVLHASIGGLRHMLVDEMQDTSAGQYELLERLTETWDGGTQTVFLVGDPKQSIYEFRQARVERFLRVMGEGRLGQLPLGAVRLTANFRSQAALVRDLNTTFGVILPLPEDLALTAESGEVPFIASTATRRSGPSPAMHWHAEEESGPVQDAEDEAPEPGAASPAAHARALREALENFADRWSRDRHGSANRPPRIAVLARNRSHFVPILEEFHLDRGRGPVPFRAVDVESLSQRPEILDLLSLARALLHPADRVAWLAVLRSPLCGLSLADLLALTDEGQQADRAATLAHLVETRADRLSPTGQGLLRRSWPVLARSLADLGRTSFRTHLERTWMSLGGDAPLQTHERSNTRRFLELLDEIERGAEALTLALLNRRLRTLYASPATAAAAVELMTIHKAKGLEWDLVLIPALERGSGRNGHEFLRWLEFDAADGSADFLLAPIQSKGEDPSRLSGWLGRFGAARETAEAKRLFYVACTRAREELHLFATVHRKADGTLITPRAGSLLEAAWPVAGPLFALQSSGTGDPAEVLNFPSSDSPGTFALAAAEEDASETAALPTAIPALAPVSRLPAGFDPLSRFRPDAGPGLPYPVAEELHQAAVFARPEGSFAARAFGNVVHRFLPVLAEQLAGGADPAHLRGVLPLWRTRLVTALRGEGLPPAQARTEAERALAALESTLGDPVGLWLLSPHAQARNEAPLPGPLGGPITGLRADRTFLAGSSPQATGAADTLWIVDYKTAELGSRSRDAFLADQKRKYLPQMEAYAAVAIASGHPPDRICLALYLPLLPAMVTWATTEQISHK